MRYQVDCDLVRKRAKCINSSYTKGDCKLYLDKALISEGMDFSNRANKFFSECNTTENADTYYEACIELIKRADDTNNSKLGDALTEKFINDVLPYVSYLDSVKESMKWTSMSNKHKTRIIDEASKYKICDRILDNHSKISKRYNIDSYVESGRNKSLDKVILSCCEMVDTYAELKPHAKMNICLEEISYLLQRHNIKYKKSDLVKYVTEYFLNRSINTSADIQSKYKKVLSENSMISDTDLFSVSYFMEDTDPSHSDLERMLNNFTKTENKDLDNDFGAIVRSAPYSNLVNRSDFCNQFCKVLRYVRQFLLTDEYDINQTIDIMSTIPTNIENQMKDDSWNYTKEELESIINAYMNELNEIELEIKNDGGDKVYLSKLIMLKDCYLDTVSRLKAIAALTYPAYNIECMVGIGSLTETMQPIHEFKVFKFNNLIKASVEAAKLIKERGAQLMSKVSGILKSSKKKKKALKEMTLEETITGDSKFDVCIETYDILKEDCEDQIHEAMCNLCKEINNGPLYNTECVAYYRILSESVEVRVQDPSTIITPDEDSESQFPMSDRMFSADELDQMMTIQQIKDLTDMIDTDRYNGLVDELKEAVETMDKDHFDTFLELSQYISCIGRDELEDIYKHYDYTHDVDDETETLFKHTAYNDATTLDIQVEAFNLLCSLLESDEEKAAINESKELKEEPKKFSLFGSIKSKFYKSLSEANDNEEDDDYDDEDSDEEENDKNNKDSKDDKNEEKQDTKKEDNKFKNNENNKDEKKSKNPFAGISLNDIKLAAKGLKTKLKDLSSKENNAATNLDMEMTRIVNSIKDAMTNDRREAIIKGSVIPSFHKCIAWGIALAGSFAVSGFNPIAPIILAVGGLAVSKNLNKKERLLLLDEIDTELEVVEKEIQIAERDEEMKKYRQLLQYKKELQRQAQRIKYNKRIGKDLLPSSDTGLRKHDD